MTLPRWALLLATFVAQVLLAHKGKEQIVDWKDVQSKIGPSKKYKYVVYKKGNKLFDEDKVYLIL